METRVKGQVVSRQSVCIHNFLIGEINEGGEIFSTVINGNFEGRSLRHDNYAISRPFGASHGPLVTRKKRLSAVNRYRRHCQSLPRRNSEFESTIDPRHFVQI